LKVEAARPGCPALPDQMAIRLAIENVGRREIIESKIFG
jgi:hypothetical protein